MDQNISPELQNSIMEYQQIQQQVQMVANQKYQMEAQTRELDAALDALAKSSKDNTVFRSVGSILVKVEDKKKLEGELAEQKESLEVRVKTLIKQEKHLQNRYQTLSQQISEAVKAPTGTSA